MYQSRGEAMSRVLALQADQVVDEGLPQGLRLQTGPCHLHTTAAR